MAENHCDAMLSTLGCQRLCDPQKGAPVHDQPPRDHATRGDFEVVPILLFQGAIYSRAHFQKISGQKGWISYCIVVERKPGSIKVSGKTLTDFNRGRNSVLCTSLDALSQENLASQRDRCYLQLLLQHVYHGDPLNKMLQIIWAWSPHTRAQTNTHDIFQRLLNLTELQEITVHEKTEA